MIHDCGGLILNSFLIAILVGAIVLILGRLHSYYLDENERIAKGMRTLDDCCRGGRAGVGWNCLWVLVRKRDIAK